MKENLLRALEALFGRSESRKRPEAARLVVEGLEDRLTPAFDMTIGAGANAFVTVNTTGNQTTVTANATGAVVSVDFLSAQFAAGNDVTINNGSGTATPPEAGAIVWTAPLNLGAIPSSGLGRTLTIQQDPSTTTGSISLGKGLPAFITGNQQNNINLVINAAGTPNYLGDPKIGLYGDSNSGINNLTANAIVSNGGVNTGVGHVEADSLITVLGNVTINSNLVVIGDGVGVDGISTANGSITVNTLLVNGVASGQVVFANADNTLAAPAGSITVNGNMAVTTAGNNLTLESGTTTVSGTTGDSSGALTFGTVTIDSTGSATFNGAVGLDGFVSAVPPGGNTYALNLLGGGYFGGIGGAKTTFDTLGVITIGNSIQDIFVFELGVSLAVASPQVGGAPIVNATMRTPGQLIELLDAALVNDVVLDTTNAGEVGFEGGGPITIDDTLAHSVTTTNLATLSLNGGSGGTVKVNAPLSGSITVIIQNSGTTEFNAPVSLTNLTINNTTSTVTFQATGTAATAISPAVSGLVLGGLTMQSGRGFEVVFANPSVATNIPAYSITGSPTGSEKLRFVGPGPVVIQQSSSGANFTGRISVEDGFLTLNGNYSTVNVDLKGGTIAGVGSAKSLNSVAPISSVIAPGGSGTVGTFTATTLALNDSSTVSVDITLAGADKLVTNNQPVLNGARLTGTVNFNTMKTGTSYIILTNNSNQPVMGIFAGLPQGGTTQIGKQVFSINYLAGDGNDVSLTAVTGSNTPIGNTPNERYVSYLYLTILGRQVDPNGMRVYTNALARGVSRNAVAASIYNSVEQRTNQVQGWYQQFLGRNGSQAQVSQYVANLRNGGSENSVISTFLLSTEFQRANPPIVPFVTALYQKLLGRNPDPAGLAINSNALRTGVTRQAMVLSFLNGSEYIQKQVRAQYLSQLGNAPNSAGLSFWVNQMSRFGYGSMVVGLASSNQAYARAQTNSV